MRQSFFVVASLGFAALAAFLHALPIAFAGAMVFASLGQGPLVAALVGSLGYALLGSVVTFAEVKVQRVFNALYTRAMAGVVDAARRKAAGSK